MRNTIFLFGFISLVFSSSLLLSTEETRTWRSGLFGIEASLEQIDGDSVKLKRTDNGTVITLPIARLSEADQQYVAGLAAQNPFEGGEDASVASRTRRPSGITVQQPVLGFPSFADLEVRIVDLSQTPAAGSNVSNVWSCEADPAPPLEHPKNVARLVFHLENLPTTATMPQRADTVINRSTGTTTTTPRSTEFFVDPVGKRAVIATHVSFTTPGVSPRDANTSRNFTRVFLGDTVSGKTMFHDTPLKLEPHGFSTDGKRFAFHQDDWSFPPNGKRTLLHIAEVTSTGWTAVATFEPFAQLKRAINRPASSIATTLNVPTHTTDADIFGVTWVDNKHLLMQSETGTLILLNIETGEAVWQTQIERRGDVSLSPGGKYCFLPIGNGGGMVLWETLTGKAVGIIDDVRLRKFRFSPNGKRFASYSSTQGIVLGDTTTGTVEAPVFVPGNDQTQHFFWLDDRFLFFGGNVVDTASKTIVWSYTGLGDNVKLVGGYCWCIFGNARQGTILTAVTLPHPAVMLRAIPADGEAELALKPGVNVSLKIEDSISEERKEIRESIEKKIAANGWILADAAPVSITLSMSKGEKADTVEYGVSRSIGPVSVPRSPIRSPLDGRGIEVEFKPERYDIKITDGEDGKELWSANKTTTPPQRLPLDVVKDDSLQEVVDKAMEAQSYRKWIDEILIPKTISRPQEGKGVSRVTENGITDIRSGTP